LHLIDCNDVECGTMSNNQYEETREQTLPNLWTWYLKGGNAYANAAGPLLKGTARCNLELISLASRRARACFDVAARLRACRSPQDLAVEQVRFWQQAVQDYSDSARCLMEAWTGALAGAARADESADMSDRDYITFAESRADAAAPAARKSASRRAA
jgi:hypothetical protein